MMIYKQYDQESLDYQYSTRLHVPDYAEYLTHWELFSRQTEQKLPVKKNLQYGTLERESLDVYPSRVPHSKTLIFLHGGYWQRLDKSMFHFIADGFHHHEVTTVLINYPLAPKVSVDQIVLSCRRAVNWLYSNISGFNGDPHQMFVAGHSAGAHLAAMLMTTPWPSFNPDLPANVLKGTCVVSGLFNLAPIHLSYINQVLQMDMETAKRNSPVRLEPSISCPLVVAVGEAESAEFKHQSEELYTCWRNRGPDIQMLELRGQNHYSIAESIADPQSPLHQALRQLMKIK